MVTGTGGLIDAARSLQGAVRDFAGETERLRQCPPALVEILHQHRLFDMVLPRAYGGLETDIVTMARVLEELAVADASTGWVVGIGCGTSIISAHLPEETARSIFRPGVVAGGAMAPNGRARAVDGGVVVSGRWPFASGCTHCSYLVGGTLVFDGEQPRIRPGGMPEWITPVFPIDEVEIIDTWHVSGLRGTGSRDMAVHEVFVPSERIVGLFDAQPHVDGPLYRYPVLGFLALTISPIPLGIARRAIDELVALAEGKTPMGSRSTLRERALTQHEIARAEARLRSARAWMYEVAAEMWERVVAGDDVSMRDRAMLRAACAHAAIEAAAVVDTAYTLGGGTALYETSVLQRCLRDAHAATQHVMLAPPNYETAGRLMLGLDPPTPFV